MPVILIRGCGGRCEFAKPGMGTSCGCCTGQWLAKEGFEHE
jgi:hypothetical protein